MNAMAYDPIEDCLWILRRRSTSDTGSSCVGDPMVRFTEDKSEWCGRPVPASTLASTHPSTVQALAVGIGDRASGRGEIIASWCG